MSEVLPMTLMPSLSRTLPQAGADSPAVVDRGVWRGAAGLTILVLAGFGFLYSLAGVGVGQALFPAQANGSVVKRGGHVIGSELVAQPFVGDEYFQPRDRKSTRLNSSH